MIERSHRAFGGRIPAALAVASLGGAAQSGSFIDFARCRFFGRTDNHGDDVTLSPSVVSYFHGRTRPFHEAV
jgi:hypothetical protein